MIDPKLIDPKLIDPVLLAILRCPIHPDGPPLVQKGPFLICAVDGSGYRVKNGIPRMLPEDAIEPSQVNSELAGEDGEEQAP